MEDGKVTVVVARDVPQTVRGWLESNEHLSLRAGKTPASAVVADTSTFPVDVVVSVPRSRPGTGGAGELGHHRTRRRLVVARRLARKTRTQLRAGDNWYADATGNVYMYEPGRLLWQVDVEDNGAAPRTDPPRGVGVVGVRVVQRMLADPGREWRVSDLADEAGCSLGQAHKVLDRLEQEGLVESARTRSRHRAILDPGLLLDWLAGAPAARRAYQRLDGFLYAPGPDELVQRIAERATASGLGYAVTGAAAGRLLGAAPTTAVPIVTVRIDEDVDLRVAAEQLGVAPGDDGANVALLQDKGRLGTQKLDFTRNTAVAPLVRVYLDLFGEPRGPDAAHLFRETAIGW